MRRALLTAALAAVLGGCTDEIPPTEGFDCAPGTCIRIATETPRFDPASSTTHYPNAQHTARTFTDFAYDVEDAAHVSPEQYGRTGDFFIQSSNGAFNAFFQRELHVSPAYFLRFAEGVTLEQVSLEELEAIEDGNGVLPAPPELHFDDRFGFPLDDGFIGRSLFFRTFNQQNPNLHRYCVMTLHDIQVHLLGNETQRVEADVRYVCGREPGNPEIRVSRASER